MDANEARRLNDNYVTKQDLNYVGINEKIRLAASSGKASIDVDLNKIDRSFRDRIFKKLKADFVERGFIVLRTSWAGDQREPVGWDIAKISW